MTWQRPTTRGLEEAERVLAEFKDTLILGNLEIDRTTEPVGGIRHVH